MINAQSTASQQLLEPAPRIADKAVLADVLHLLVKDRVVVPHLSSLPYKRNRPKNLTHSPFCGKNAVFAANPILCVQLLVRIWE